MTRRIRNFLTRHRFPILLSGVVTYLCIQVLYYVFFLNSWFDEAEYGYKAWLIAKGLSPFLDFRVKQGPVSLYGAVLVEYAFGPSLLALRVVSALFLLGSAYLLYRLGKKMGGKWMGLLSLALLAFHPFLIGGYSAGVPYAMAIFFSLLATWILYKKDTVTPAAIACASIAMSLAFLVRYNMIPALAVLFLLVFLRRKRWTDVLIALAASAATVFLCEIPYLLLDAKFALVWFLMMFGPLATILPLDYYRLPSSFYSDGTGAYLFLNADHLKLLVTLFIKYFHLWVIALAGSAYLVIAWRERRADPSRPREDHGLIVACCLLALALFAAHFLGPQANMLYSLYFIPFLILFCVGALQMLRSRLERAGAWHGDVRRHALILLVALLVFTPVSLGLSGPDVIFFNHFRYADSDLQRIQRGADALRAVTTPQDVIFSIDNPSQIFLAGRFEIPPLINKGFNYVASGDPVLVEHYKLYDINLFMDWLRNRATVVVFQKDYLEEFMTDINAADRLPEMKQVLATRYDLVASPVGVYQRKDQRGDGIMMIYRKKTGATPQAAP